MAIRKPKQSATSSSKNQRNSSSLFRRIFAWTRKIIFYFLILSVGSVILFKFLPIPITFTMIDQKLSNIGSDNGSELYYSWRSWDKISKEFPLAVVAAEDQTFPEHIGFNFESMSNAYKNNLKGKKVRGGSTISQQTAKNVFLWQSRSYIRKLLEAYFTALIEVIWGKQRILEVYMNVAETGPSTFGVEAAAQRYYGKSAKNLTRGESARIAAILPSPRKWSVKNAGPYVSRRSAQIAAQMRALGGTAYISNLRKF